MANLALDLEVMKLVALDPATPIPGPQPAPPANAQLAALGAIGPDLFQHLPIGSDLSQYLGTTIDKLVAGLTPDKVKTVLANGAFPLPDLNQILNPATPADTALRNELFENPLMSAYSVLFQKLVLPFWTIIEDSAATLQQLQTVADNEDEAGAKAMSGAVDQLKADADKLDKELLPALVGLGGFLQVIPAIPTGIQLTTAGAKPWIAVMSERLFEFLRWNRTSALAGKLVSTADTDAKKAYGYGYLCHVAASVTAKPFVNNIVGGPYRSHWWRHRWVGNFVDAWTWGRYETAGAAMNGDVPSPAASPSQPPYAGWVSICNANIQTRFDVAGMGALPGRMHPSIAAVAAGVGSATFPVPAQPPAQPPSIAEMFPADIASYIQDAIASACPIRPPGFSVQAIQEAAVGLFAVAWFMTSGAGPMTPITLGNAPSSCTTPPSWVTSGGSPPSPQQSGPSTAATVCAVILAILALLLFLTQNYLAGAGAVAAAIALLASGGGIDWDQLRCDVFWLRSIFLKQQLALVDALVSLGLAYPSPDKLGTSTANGVVPASAKDGSPLIKSSSGSLAAGPAPYPLQMDASVPAGNGLPDLDFGHFPPFALETPAAMNFPVAAYPDFVVDGAPVPAAAPMGILTPAAFPSANRFFGGAVANAKLLIANEAADLPAYNLDADRGYGWLTWRPKAGTFPGSGSVDAISNP